MAIPEKWWEAKLLSNKLKKIAWNEDSSWLTRNFWMFKMEFLCCFLEKVWGQTIHSSILTSTPPPLSCWFRLESKESLIPRSLTSSGASPHSCAFLHHCAFTRSERKDGTIFAGSAFNAPCWRTLMTMAVETHEAFAVQAPKWRVTWAMW